MSCSLYNTGLAPCAAHPSPGFHSAVQETDTKSTLGTYTAYITQTI